MLSMEMRVAGKVAEWMVAILMLKDGMRKDGRYTRNSQCGSKGFTGDKDIIDRSRKVTE